MRRFHIAVALLAVLSVVSLLGISLVGGESPGGAVQVVKIKSTSPVEKNVWWKADAYNAGWGAWSGTYSSWGRTYLHVQMVATGLAAGQEIKVRVYGILYNATKTEFLWIKAVELTLTSTSASLDYQMMVPSKQFWFHAGGPSGSKISLSFYLSGS